MVKCFDIKPGMKLYYIPAEKFKTVSISMHLHRPLRREEASLNALLTDVMKRGCEKYPDAIAIEQAMQALYGAYFDADVRKKGEDQILSFAIKVLNDKYAMGDSGLALSALELLLELVLHPLTQNGAFQADIVKQEKINLINDIQAVINDKRSYSVMRLIELMCEGEAYGVYELGSVEQTEQITPEGLYAHYQRILREGPIDFFVTGDADISALCAKIADCFGDIQPSYESYPKTGILEGAAQPNEVVEEFDVAQAKLCMGYRTHISPNDSDYFPLMVYNGILGGGAHSKLFNNVREKLSLAYYAGSRLERFKGMMVISSGIEIANKQKAMDEIKAQVEAMKQGDIAEYEFDATIKALVNSIGSFGDNIGHLEDYYLGQMVSGHTVSLEEFIARIQAVTPEDVVRVAQGVELDTVYFLTGKGGAQS